MKHLDRETRNCRKSYSKIFHDHKGSAMIFIRLAIDLIKNSIHKCVLPMKKRKRKGKKATFGHYDLRLNEEKGVNDPFYVGLTRSY